MGANEYVNKLRIEKAMELLRQTELNMTEIAEHYRILYKQVLQHCVQKIYRHYSNPIQGES